MVPNRPSATAEGVCLMRAAEQRRPAGSRIVDDPYAAWFLRRPARAALRTWAASGRVGDLVERRSPGLTTLVLCRHRWMDDRLAAALRDGVEQVVLLGAGYDTRAYRFADALAGRPVFEVDFPATSRRKADVIAQHAAETPAVDDRVVEIDFETDDLGERLAAAGFTPGRRTFFVWEGVCMYLTRNAVEATLDTLAALSSPGSELVMDCWYVIDGHDLLSTARRVSAQLLGLIGEPVTFAIHPDDVVPFLARHGWTAGEIATTAELAARYGAGDRTVEPSSYVVSAARDRGTT